MIPPSMSGVTARVCGPSTWVATRSRLRLFYQTAKLFTFDGALERTFEMGGAVHCIAILPDGLHFVAGVRHDDGEVRLYEMDAKQLYHNFSRHPHSVSALAVAPNGRYIFSSADDAADFFG